MKCPYAKGRLLWEFTTYSPGFSRPLPGAVVWVQRGSWRVRTICQSRNLVAAGYFGNEAQGNYVLQLKVDGDAFSNGPHD